MIYEMKEAVIGFPANVLLDRVSFEIRNTEKICIVGRNGCGKTTLLRVIAGRHDTDNLNSDEDFFIRKKSSLSVGYLEQMNFENETATVREELAVANEELVFCHNRMEELSRLLEERPGDERLLAEYTSVSGRFEAMDGYAYPAEMEQIFTRFGFASADMDRPINTFSGGQKTKIAFAKLLLSKPDVCLLDEPTNHLDLPAIEWLEGYLKSYAHAVVIVSHDRMFLDRVADITYEIEHKRMKRYVGNYTAFIRQKQLDYEKQCADYEAQQKEIERLTTFIEKWKNTPTKVSMTRSKRMQIEHMVKIEKPLRFDVRAMHNKFQPARAGVAEVLTVRNLKLGYDKELATVSFQLRKGQRLAVLGENGRGKSTLLKTLVGQVPAFSASGDEVRFGRETDIAYFDQELMNLSEDKTVIEEFWDAYPTLRETEVRTILGNFLFTGEDVYQLINRLSGGERVRLSLAILMKRQANLLILDEPTNHLDMIGKEALESILRDYQGTILFVSHDRYFVKSVATCLLMFENGEVNMYACDYETYCRTQSEKERDAKKEPTMHGNERAYEKYEVKAGTGEIGLSAKEAREAQKEQQRRERRLAAITQEIEDQEKVVERWKIRFTDPEIAADFEKLDEIHQRIVLEEDKLNELLLEWSGLV